MYDDRRKVVFQNIHHGSAFQNKGDIVYAELYDALTGDLIISATLDYILKAVEERNYRFVAEFQKIERKE